MYDHNRFPRASNDEFPAMLFAFDEPDFLRVEARARRLRSEAFYRLVLRPIGRTLRRAVRAVRDDLKVHATVRSLSRLDDRTLSDIGLHRGDLLRAAQDAVRPRVTPAAAPTVRPASVTPGRASANDDGDATEPRRVAV